LLLALAARFPNSTQPSAKVAWEKSSSGTEVRGKTLGLIGLGRIGSEVASRAEAFDMRVLAYDPYISESAAKECRWISFRSISSMPKATSSLCTPLSVPQTTNMINAASIAKMKKGARIVNAARGELNQRSRLGRGLKSGRLGGAGPWTSLSKNRRKNSPLIGLPNVVGTPHIAAPRKKHKKKSARKSPCKSAITWPKASFETL